MRLPRVPSLQHFARLSDANSEKINFRLKELSENPPWLSYNQAKPIARDHLTLNTSETDVLRAALLVKGERKRAAINAALIAFLKYARTIEARRYIDVQVRYFPIGRHLLVPVNPFLFGVGPNGPVLLWLSYWSALNLTETQLAIFATLLELTFFQTPDFVDVELEFVDLGKPPQWSSRDVRIFRRQDLPQISERELRKFTDAFVDGYLSVREEIIRSRYERDTRRPTGSDPLFLDNPF